MSYKTILVHVDDAKNANARLELAAKLAVAENAHLIGSALTGVSRFLTDTVATAADAPAIAPYLDTLRQRAERLLIPFEEIARRTGVASFEKRLTDEEPAVGISLQARYCDLVVLGQYDAQAAAPGYPHLPEYVAMNSGAPVLIVPYASAFKSTGERILIAWNGGIEARKAVNNALPLLRRAKIVEVAVFNPGTRVDTHGEVPGADIASYLARHDIKVDVLQEEANADVGAALLSLAANLGSDLLVMGCYGHSRFREVLLGGVTRTMLGSMTTPVLMSH